LTAVHVVVRVGGESYALPVENVLEVAPLGRIAAVPGSPASVLGVRNLRGQILPVFDLASVLGLHAGEARARVLVAECDNRRAGFAVDEVHDVEALPAAEEETRSRLLAGAALTDGELVGIVDVPALFASLVPEAAKDEAK